MAKIITIHSFRRSTGKSNIAANLAVLWAATGQRVGLVDIAHQFPGIQTLFGLHHTKPTYSFNDYLTGKCTIQQVAQNITPQLGADLSGELFLFSNPTQITISPQKKRHTEYDAELLGHTFQELGEVLELDLLILDTQAGLHKETLISITFADVVAILLRPDRQDYQGTALTVQLIQHLNIPRSLLVVNVVPSSFDLASIKSQVEKVYSCQVAAVLPHSHELTMLASKEIFVLSYPDHPLTEEFKQLAGTLLI